MKRAFIGTLLSMFTLTLLGLAGCGSSDSPALTPIPPPATKTAYMVGSLIEHLPYTCGTTSGRTGRIGQFSYQEGQSCTFKLGKMSFTVGPDKLKKGYVTAYDLTRTKEEAWTLMAIIESISNSRPNSDLILIVDPNLEPRVHPTDLAQGDTAVKMALSPFKGTVNAVTVQEARSHLAKTVKDDNTLALSHDQIVAQGKAILDSLGLHIESGKPWEAPTGTATKSVTTHSNVVNLRFYDHNNNPMRMDFGNSTASPANPGGGAQWKWVTGGQDPNDSGVKFCMSCADISSSNMNIGGLVFDVGRSASNSPASAFMLAAYGAAPEDYTLTGGPGSLTLPPLEIGVDPPVTLFGQGAHPSETSNKTFPKQLNFAFALDLRVYNAYTHVPLYLDDILFGQGSTTPTVSKVLDFVKDLYETKYEGFEAISEEGEDIESDFKFLKSTYDTVMSAIDLGTSNWWVVSAESLGTYKLTYQGHAAMIMYSHDRNGSTIPVIITSPYDDHTFDLHVIYPGQTINGITL